MRGVEKGGGGSGAVAMAERRTSRQRELVVLDTAATSHKRGCESNGGVLLREMQRGQGSQVREKGEDLLMGVYRAARDDGQRRY